MRILAISLLLLLGGCSSNPWAYNTPPGHGQRGVEALHKPVILMDQLVLDSGIDEKWSGFAPEMQQALVRALMNTGKFDVVTDSRLAAKASKIIARHDISRTESLAEIRIALQADSAFLVHIRVTDFLHTTDAPASVRRRSWLTEANDALVALDVTAMDLQVGKTIFSDQIVAMVSVGDEGTDQYGTLEFGSYLFWSTPLGRASSDVLDKAVVRLSSLRGGTPGGVMITKYEQGNREVKLSGGDLLDDGAIYYLGGEDLVSGKYISIDDDLGKPLRLRVEKNFWGKCSGWLLGEPAEYEQMIGATLSKTPLSRQLTFEELSQE